jgi:CRISPR/Cas system endoribonuclease Cas6 (RAMP superfamily)
LVSRYVQLSQHGCKTYTYCVASKTRHLTQLYARLSCVYIAKTFTNPSYSITCDVIFTTHIRSYQTRIKSNECALSYRFYLENKKKKKKKKKKAYTKQPPPPPPPQQQQPTSFLTNLPIPHHLLISYPTHSNRYSSTKINQSKRHNTIRRRRRTPLSTSLTRGRWHRLTRIRRTRQRNQRNRR